MNLLAKGRRAVSRRWRGGAGSTADTASPASARLARSAAGNPSPTGRDPGEVAKVAYELFLQRGAAHGSDLDDWLRAEQIVAARQRSSGHRNPS